MYQFIYNICLSFMAYNTKNQETKKEKRARELQKFRSIFAALKERFTLDEIAEKAKIQSSNLSAYGSGAKDPNAATIEKFYKNLKVEIARLPRQRKAKKNSDGQADHVDEETFTYKRAKRPKDINGDLVDNLINNNNRLWAHSEKNSKMFDAIVESNIKLVDNNTVLVTNNARLVNSIFSNRRFPWVARTVNKKGQ